MKLSIPAVVGVMLVAAQAHAMELTSANIANGASLSPAQVHAQCGGGNQSPALSWSDGPPETKSYALTVFDTDVHGGWWHWLVFNIPANIRSLPTDAGGTVGLPTGAVQAQNDFGVSGYGGACPPSGSGTHHYEFTLWALDAPNVPFDAKATGANVGPFLKAHAVATSKLVAVYQR
jgi:Raf kinase inhibitor-like YbhB/YbcL family protein